MVIRYFIWIAIGYLMGGIPSGLLIGKLFGGPDPRKSGSRNIGATNVFRVIGVLPALLTLICDLLKGYLPLIILSTTKPSAWLSICVGLAAILGHDFSPYIKFKGGKGVATSLGVFLFLSPKAILVSFVIWILILIMIRIVSVASIGASIILSVAIYGFGYPKPILWGGILASLILIIRHKKNIERLCRGEEKRLARAESKK